MQDYKEPHIMNVIHENIQVVIKSHDDKGQENQNGDRFKNSWNLWSQFWAIVLEKHSQNQGYAQDQQDKTDDFHRVHADVLINLFSTKPFLILYLINMANYLL
mgnify:CR=1 FL=1